MTQVKKPGAKWKFAVDRGGTFTDVIGVDPHGRLHALKILSSSPDYGDPSIEGIRRILGLSSGEPLPAERIGAIRFGTTVATNALLERKGGRVALFITRGFADLLDIGHQSRPDIFSLCTRKTPPLYSIVCEVKERIDHEGKVVEELDIEDLEERIASIEGEDLDAVAVVFLNSYRNAAHELLCGRILRQRGFGNVFLSHRTMNLIKVVTRGQSTVVDAYLSPVLGSYVDSIKTATAGIPIEFIQSSGGLCPPGRFRGKDAVLSGPAGGVVAVARLAEDMGLKGAIGFDMGGTSTDVSRYEGDFERVYETKVGGIEFQAEMLNIMTVASGGGSVLWFDGQKMKVGPDSAGASPGPACYGFGGPLTLTDANLLTGRLATDFFPETFGPDRRSPLHRDDAAGALQDLTEEINRASKRELTPVEAALGFLRIANEKMAAAIKEISVSRGFDVREYALVCFGGAGGQHACEVASLLGMETVLFHPLGGLLSALGTGLARPERKVSLTVLERYDGDSHRDFLKRFGEMEAGLEDENPAGTPVTVRRLIDLRVEGTDTFLTVPFRDYEETAASFRRRYERIFGFCPPRSPLEAVNLRVEAREERALLTSLHAGPSAGDRACKPLSRQEIHYPDGPVEAPIYPMEALSPGRVIKGPCLVADRHSTFVIDPGFEACLTERGVITARRTGRRSRWAGPAASGPDPVLLEVFNNTFSGIAAEMGWTLKNTAHSVNIKERLDFSCAVFDAGGDLVANAPHIPVHLGSMADTVKAVISDRRGDMKPGDVYLTNNPYKGGSHLPDMTVICPVFSDEGEVLFYTAARGHHSDMGGGTPGSMPPMAGHIEEEGIVVDNFLLVREGVFREEEITSVLGGHSSPARNLRERLSDLRAQIAACRKGATELVGLIGRYGWSTVRDYMGYIQQNAEYAVKEALHRFLGGKDTFESSFEDRLDDGTPLRVRIRIEGGTNPPETVRAVIDFTGTGAQHLEDNLNAPRSVTNSAVLYVLRALTAADIPLNSGCLKAVEIIIPPSTILSPDHPAPVASGNVETSQRVVDLLLGALGVAGASQGTMNNLLFEAGGSPPYYETIAGGSGAVEGCPGAAGVQVHMTNTRMTDPEVLESRHPEIRLRRFTLRKGSGGEGLYRGGDGVIREVLFLEPATVSVISERRVHPPYGMAGGEPGRRGVNLVRRADGKIKKLPHRFTLTLDRGDSIIIKTPGGGGYGQARGGE